MMGNGWVGWKLGMFMSMSMSREIRCGYGWMWNSYTFFILSIYLSIFFMIVGMYVCMCVCVYTAQEKRKEGTRFQGLGNRLEMFSPVLFCSVLSCPVDWKLENGEQETGLFS